jgi:sulfoxide reductase heme-binding subunit YedZ
MPLSRLLIWFLLAAPLALLTYNYVFETAWLLGEVYYGRYVHDTGRYAAWLLLAVLVISPLRLSFPGSFFLRWLAAQRRYLGVAAFAYAAAHLIAYLLRQEWARILEDLATPGFWTGWIAFFIFVPLAVTSNDLTVRLMRRAWKSLHRLAHLAAILVFAHWVLTAFDPFLAWCHVAGLALIEAWRLIMSYRPRRAAIT